MSENLVLVTFLIFFGAAILSTFALYTKQSTLVAYILLGILIGPYGLRFVQNIDIVREIGDVGILFLLFLLGLHLPISKLMHMLKKVASVGLWSSLIFFVIGAAVPYFVGLTTGECLAIGAAMMFSSTIIGIKLLPTTILHHQHTGEVMISVLLFQDIIAIAVLLMVHGASGGASDPYSNILILALGVPLMLVLVYVLQRWVLNPLFRRFNRVREYLFLLSIGWCLCLAEACKWLGLSAEIGAFIAGVSLASSPVSVYVAESLKPVRDFFLVMFFFSVGANFNLSFLSVVIVPAIILVVLLMFVKPYVYKYLLSKVGEDRSVAWEVGVRLGQVSEFSLIIAYLCMESTLIGKQAVYLIEATTILSFAISSYWVMLKFPTPLAVTERLRRD